jgi:Sec-independent protein secretion pathway component TatC
MGGMEPTPTEPGLFAWLFDRDYFKSLRYWRWDVLGCCCLAAAVTPADPVSLLIVGIPLTAAWLLIRYAIVCSWSKGDRG